jgi:hypothetical protein
MTSETPDTPSTEALTPTGETWRCVSCRDTTAPMGMCQKCGVFGTRQAERAVRQEAADTSQPDSETKGHALDVEREGVLDRLLDEARQYDRERLRPGPADAPPPASGEQARNWLLGQGWDVVPLLITTTPETE